MDVDVDVQGLVTSSSIICYVCMRICVYMYVYVCICMCSEAAYKRRTINATTNIDT